MSMHKGFSIRYDGHIWHAERAADEAYRTAPTFALVLAEIDQCPAAVSPYDQLLADSVALCASLEAKEKELEKVKAWGQLGWDKFLELSAMKPDSIIGRLRTLY